MFDCGDFENFQVIASRRVASGGIGSGKVSNDLLVLLEQKMS